MKFTLPINYERERGSYEKYYHYLNHKKKRKAIIWLFIGIIYLLAGLLLHKLLPGTTNDNIFKTILLCLGGIQTLVYANYLLFTLPKHKKKYFDEIDRQYRILAENNVKEYTLELNEDHLLIDDSLNTAKVSWNRLHSYQIVDDILLLHTSKGHGLFYLFSKNEFSNEDFSSIISFVKTKLKQR